MWLVKGSLRIKKLRKRIEDAGTFDEQTREANSVRPVVENQLSQSEQRAGTLAARAQEESERRNAQCVKGHEPFTIQPEHYLAFVLWLGALVTMILDVGLSAVLATTWINLSWWQAPVVGALVATILSLMCKAGLLALIYDTEKPRPTRRRLQWISAISFIASFGFIAFILAMRNPTENWLDYIITLTGFSLGALGVLMPILAGALLALSYDFDWSYRYEREYRALRHEVAETTGFLAWLNSLCARTPRTFLLLIGALALSLVLNSAVYAAQDPVLDIWMDDSRSIAQPARESGVENLRRQLSSLIGKQGLKQIRVAHFSHAPWEAKMLVFELPKLQQTLCSDVNSRGETRIFKQFEQQRRKKAEDACSAQRTQAQQEYDVKVTAILASVSRALLTLQQAQGQCTALYDLFGRLATGSKAKLTVIITDAAETCRKAPGRVTPPFPANNVMVLLVPEKNRNGGIDEFRLKKERLARLAAWAKVEPLFSERLCEIF